ncbi:MAG: type IV toxin-antitoxin system AbiEi family antitoxin domain-containing protein [Synergistaceae bacterium]|jgi:hypothetical protein|nr:type IV toxin-antitoxin system AbiEi family antitoxin domain-containing protein [Synergistaceae bacterium]
MTLKDYEMIQAMLAENNGFISAAQVTAAGIQRRTLGELVAMKRIYIAARGIDALPEAWEDEWNNPADYGSVGGVIWRTAKNYGRRRKVNAA